MSFGLMSLIGTGGPHSQSREAHPAIPITTASARMPGVAVQGVRQVGCDWHNTRGPRRRTFWLGLLDQRRLEKRNGPAAVSVWPVSALMSVILELAVSASETLSLLGILSFMIWVMFPPSWEKHPQWRWTLEVGTSEATRWMIPSNPSFFFISSIFVFLHFVKYPTCIPFPLLFIAEKGLSNPASVAKRNHWGCSFWVAPSHLMKWARAPSNTDLRPQSFWVSLGILVAFLCLFSVSFFYSQIAGCRKPLVPAYTSKLILDGLNKSQATF